MQKKLVIVDHFLKDPTKLTRLEPLINQNNGGFGFHLKTSFNTAKSIADQVTEAVGVDLAVTSNSTFSGHLRKTPSEQLRTSYRFRAHYDIGYNIIIYLSPDHRQGGGTAFYRHKKTGLDSLFDPEQVLAVTKKKKWTLEKLLETLDHDQNEPKAWQQVSSIAARFNRLVFFNGLQFHSHLAANESGKIHARLTLNYFEPFYAESDSKTRNWLNTLIRYQIRNRKGLMPQ
jgi:hypothetical protein